MHQFADLEKISENYREHNDCAVKAIAAACDVSYGKAHRTLSKHGRQHRRGSSLMMIQGALDALYGINTPIKHAFDHDGVGLTLNRFRKAFASGTYIVCTASHAVCVREGELIDWTAEGPGRRKVAQVFKIK